MLNFIAFILCLIAAIIQAFDGNILLVILEAFLALVNLPFALEWLRNTFKRR